MSWAPEVAISQIKEEAPQIYQHGFSPEEVVRITEERNKLFDLIAKGHATTLEEFKNIIVPYQRIYRTEQFILNPPKPVKEKKERVAKVKAEKAPKEPKAPKVKKPTAKELRERTERVKKIIMKQATGAALTEDDLKFLETMRAENGT